MGIDITFPRDILVGTKKMKVNQKILLYVKYQQYYTTPTCLYVAWIQVCIYINRKLMKNV